MIKQTAIRHAGLNQTLTMLLALVIAALAIITFGVSTVAQDQMIDFRIFKLDCEEDPGNIPDGLIPEGCTPAEGVAFTISPEGDTEPTTCTTNADGRCTVQVRSEAMVMVTEDESTATEGTTPRENPIKTQAVTEFAGAIFVNVEDDAPTDLPDTGSGIVAQETGQGMAATLVVLATLLAASGIMVRRPSGR